MSNTKFKTVIESRFSARRPHAESAEGQALVITALLLVVLLLFVGLGVDVGNLMARRAKLQSAVDASALSAAQMLVSDAQSTPRQKAEQMMVANGVPLTSLAQTLTVDEYAALFQVHIAAVQRVDTYFMRLLPGFETVNISAQATADLSSYAEINAKPFGEPGVVNQVNLMVWGRYSHRRHGDAYSPEFDSLDQDANGNLSNPLFGEQPHGYLFRIDVPASFPGSDLIIEAFDPDTYNRPGYPPDYVRSHTNNATRDPDQFASCTSPAWDAVNQRPGQYCTTTDGNQNPGLLLDAYLDRKPAFWRVDEYRYRYNESSGNDNGAYQSRYATQTFFTLWHFDPRITTVFADPEDLSDSGGPLGVYEIREDPSTDLRWVQIFRINNFRRFAREDNGKWYFYLYVQGEEGSSENNYDLRVGYPQDLACPRNVLTNTYPAHCYVNQLYRDANYGYAPYGTFHRTLELGGYCTDLNYDDVCDARPKLWLDGGARLFAKRALPLNLVTGSGFPLLLTQVPKEAAGQTLGIRHFDMDGNSDTIVYQMEKCNSGFPLEDDRAWQTVATDIEGPNNNWAVPPPQGADPRLVQIPTETSADYATFFGTACPTSWLRMRTTSSGNQDTTVWEIPFIRPRLIR
jgi:hypothetical protein